MKRRIKDYNILSGYSFHVPGIRGMVGLVLMFIAGSFFGSGVNMAISRYLGLEFAAEYGMLIAYPLSFMPAMMFASFQSKRNALFDGGYALDSNNFEPLGGGRTAVLAALATLLAAYIFDAVMGLMPQMPSWLEEALKNITNGELWVSLLCASIMAPIFEEWLCRGMILRGLLCHERPNGEKGYRPATAIVVSAFIFALIHMNPWQAIPAFLLGCLFGFVYYRTGSLKLTMLMHCVNNTFAVLMSRIPAFEDADTWIDVLGPVKYWILWAGFAIMMVLVIKRLMTIKPSGENGSCEEVIADIGQGNPLQ